MKKVYLAIPYTDMMESSFQQANEATALILNKGTNVFSPISHCHHIAKEYDLPKTWNFWKQIDYQYIDWADEVWVLCPIEGLSKIKESTGVQAEIKYAKDNDKKIRLIRVNNNQIEFSDLTEKALNL